jgi:hypothetical protein
MISKSNNLNYVNVLIDLFKFSAALPWRISREHISIKENKPFIQNKELIFFPKYFSGEYFMVSMSINTERNICSWALPLFVKGFKKNLAEEDLYGPLKDHESKLLGDRLENAWIKEENSRRNPSFWRALIRVFGKECAMYGLMLALIEFVIK